MNKRSEFATWPDASLPNNTRFSFRGKCRARDDNSSGVKVHLEEPVEAPEAEELSPSEASWGKLAGPSILGETAASLGTADVFATMFVRRAEEVVCEAFELGRISDELLT